MGTYSARHVEAVLDVAQSADLNGSALIDALVGSLAIGVTSVSIFELDVAAGAQVFYEGTDAGQPTAAPGAELDRVFWSLFWTAPCSYTEPRSPFAHHGSRLNVVSPESFFTSWREYTRTPIYDQYGRAVGLGHHVIVPLTTQPGATRRILLNREVTEGRFCDADLLWLRLLQPHLDAALGRAFTAPAPADLLSPRELQVLSYLRAGHSTATIARLLWVEPSTVRKHLENAYTKLGVHNRTAALARVFGIPTPAPA
jgi:DNA-binding CsgD family transcriptional regulator